MRLWHCEYLKTESLDISHCKWWVKYQDFEVILLPLSSECSNCDWKLSWNLSDVG